jgi:UDP-N-acetylmuramoyl-L-alanyl-D-glutamate--2,6-diaminopimelate ligase
VTKTLGQLIAGEAPVPPGAEALPVAGLTADSRAVKPGFVFAALSGSKADGAAFIPQAVAAGAIAVAAGASATAAVPIIATENPRRLYAHMAARFFDTQPGTVVAVTGTSGKTSVAGFTREIWTALGLRAASLGTIGIVAPSGT